MSESEAPIPGEIDVAVVRAHLADFSDLTSFVDVLSEDEHARADKYKVAEAQKVFTLARGLLRLELAKRLLCDPTEIAFDLRPSGKPDLRATGHSRPDWRFSVSHTGAHVAIAFAQGVDIGLDIERINRTVNHLDIARRYFTAQEMSALEAAPPGSLARTFFAGWTRKEAIVKARGSTMAESLNTLSVSLDPQALHPGSEDAPATKEPPACRLTTFEFPEFNLMGAVALRWPHLARLRFEVLSTARFD